MSFSNPWNPNTPLLIIDTLPSPPPSQNNTLPFMTFMLRLPAWTKSPPPLHHHPYYQPKHLPRKHPPLHNFHLHQIHYRLKTLKFTSLISMAQIPLIGSSKQSNTSHFTPSHRNSDSLWGEFEKLANQVDGLSPSSVLNCFIGGLLPQIQREMSVLKIHTLSEAGDCAALIEEKLADFSSSVPYPGKVPSITIGLQGNEFTLDLFLLDIWGAEVVLGVEWLSQLGPFLADYKALYMSFYDPFGHRVTLQGDKPTQVSPATCQ
ncbi:hypothetical protein COLO4_34254 [Corchorus olitorius]|uniref:Uncharacterized protein n=1 Tax=Corchorus olitorius TaxID=93759 RepID=A0A1R3GMK5_9ROSI|nr:hypothetical protein COLO4_34254 [Corchorus olitorius]